jgi:hypothetical protein
MSNDAETGSVELVLGVEIVLGPSPFRDMNYIGFAGPILAYIPSWVHSYEEWLTSVGRRWEPFHKKSHDIFSYE